MLSFFPFIGGALVILFLPARVVQKRVRSQAPPDFCTTTSRRAQELFSINFFTGTPVLYYNNFAPANRDGGWFSHWGSFYTVIPFACPNWTNCFVFFLPCTGSRKHKRGGQDWGRYLPSGETYAVLHLFP